MTRITSRDFRDSECLTANTARKWHLLYTNARHEQAVARYLDAQ